MSDYTKHQKFFSDNKNVEEDKFILQPCLHLNITEQIEANILLEILRGFNHWLKISENDFQTVFTVVQIFYTRETLIDDMQDGTELRNGAMTAHLKYGLARTINSCEYVGAVMFQKCLQFPEPLQAIKHVIDAQLLTHKGQGKELYWRENILCPTYGDYLQNGVDKNAIVLLAVKLMQEFSTNKNDFSKLTELLCMYLQLCNDLVNLTSVKYMETKGYYDDINEGKFSFPIIHGIKSRPEDHRIIDVLKQEFKSDEDKAYCASLLKEFGSFKYTEDVLVQLKNNTLKEIERHGENPIISKSLDGHFNVYN